MVGGCLSFLTGGLTESNNKKFTNTAFKVPCLILLVFSEVVDVPYPHENLHPGTKNKSSTNLYYYIIGCSFFNARFIIIYRNTVYTYIAFWYRIHNTNVCSYSTATVQENVPRIIKQS